ncbi:hypothetical protein [Actinophytocola sp.]|uniref:hypothetical protein n=1 Tax=Actinophytocola sp. TaxID=1872138 RepID=UPI003D6A4486
MEEELFGRDEIDTTVGDQRRADPMHPSRLYEPIRWLLDEPGRLRMECTGFGLNVVSGNYEFASLISIGHQEFWTRFGGAVARNPEPVRTTAHHASFGTARVPALRSRHADRGHLAPCGPQRCVGD